MSDLFEYKNYLGSFRMDPIARCFTGKIEFITDLIMFEGSEFNELEENFKIAVDDYLELCKELNKNPNKSFNGNLNVRLGPDLHRAAAMEAKKEGVKLNQFLSQCVRVHLATKEHTVTHNHVHKVNVSVHQRETTNPNDRGAVAEAISLKRPTSDNHLRLVV